MLWILYLVPLIVISLYVFHERPFKKEKEMKSVLFHDGWKCRHLNEPGEGIAVSVPDNAMLREKRSAMTQGGLNVGWFEGYDYLYRKHFSLSPEEVRLHHVLEFEGVYRCAEVRINEKQAGFRPNGYINFYVDCDGFLTAGENTVEVIAHNADQPNSRWYSGAGIYRPVRMWSGEQEHVEVNGVKIRTLSLDPAQIEVTVKTSSEGHVSSISWMGKGSWHPTKEPADSSGLSFRMRNHGVRNIRRCISAGCALGGMNPWSPSVCVR